MPRLLFVGGKMAEADEFVEDKKKGEGVTDRCQEGGPPTDGDREESGGQQGEERGGEHPPGFSAIDTEEAPGHLEGSERKNQAEAGIEQPVGNGARGGKLAFCFHFSVSRKGTS